VLKNSQLSRKSEQRDAAIARLAHKQQGYVTRKQLLRLGLSSADIARRVAAGQLIRVSAGVYAVGHVPASPVARAAGAVLACGPHAVLSHGSAATLWGFSKTWRLPFEVTAPSDHRRKGIMVHRSKVLLPRDITIQLGVRVTSAARTVLDNAPRLTERQVARMVNDARLARRLRLAQLADVIDRFPCHPGAARLRPLAEKGGNPTRSTFEDDFPGFCEQHGLPIPEMNATVCGYEVDGWFETERVVVELDGWDVHRSRQAFEDDRDKDATLLAAGIVTVRITKRRIETAPAREAARIRRILTTRRP
jgi:Transcriptional regulator, AbiEi antitoxin